VQVNMDWMSPLNISYLVDPNMFRELPILVLERVRAVVTMFKHAIRIQNGNPYTRPGTLLRKVVHNSLWSGGEHVFPSLFSGFSEHDFDAAAGRFSGHSRYGNRRLPGASGAPRFDAARGGGKNRAGRSHQPRVCTRQRRRRSYSPDLPSSNRSSIFHRQRTTTRPRPTS
jgi:hypothetical protein